MDEIPECTAAAICRFIPNGCDRNYYRRYLSSSWPCVDSSDNHSGGLHRDRCVSSRAHRHLRHYWVRLFLLHNVETSNTDGQQLANELGNRPRVVVATGSVITEPKAVSSGFATFLLELRSIEFEGRNRRTRVVWQARWKGEPKFGDELKLSGIAEVIAPPRNPGEFDMRSYLARRDVRRCSWFATRRMAH